MKKILILVLVFVFVFPTAVFAAPPESPNPSVRIPNGPKFWIADVERGETVTIRVAEFPKGKMYQVYLGLPGDSFGRGYLVGRLTDKKGKNYAVTFEIPKEIRMKTHIAILIWDKTDGSHGYDIFTNDTGYNYKQEMSFSPVHRSSAQSAGKSVGIFNGPVFWAGSQGFPKTFTLRFTDFYTEGSYTVFIGVNNSDFPSTIVGYINDSKAPQFSKTFDIPLEFRDADEIKVTVQNAFNGHSGTVAFKNDDGYPSVTPEGYFTEGYLANSSSSGYISTPFTKILNVVKDGEVTLQVFNFPPNKDFLVTMGTLGTQGIGGFVIGTQSSGDGGSFIVTYPIPAQLYGSDTIAIRMESTTSDHFVYDYFQNADGYNPGATGGTTTTAGDWSLPAGTYPHTNVTAVVKDTSVTITGTNFTKNDVYTVRMGAIGTQGVGGIVVDSFSTGASGAFTATFQIPAGLKGAAQIAIRFESNNTVYYAYDWFNNTTGP